MISRFFKYVILIISIFSSFSYSQVKTNLEVVESLVSQSVNEIDKDLQTANSSLVAFKFNSAMDYDVLKNVVINYLQEKKYTITEITDSTKIEIDYNILEVKVEYPAIFRDGLFGDYLLSRNIFLKGSYSLNKNSVFGKIKNFSFNKADTIAYNDINDVENIAYTFTSSEVPEEPFFSSALEPVLAIGTAAAVVYLFFNIRSK